MRSRMRWAASAALLSMVAACGGVATGGGGSSGGGQQKGGDVLIGASYPLTGIWAENGQNCVQGMQLAADEINAAGGIKALGGAKVKIVTADTSSNDPGQAKTVTAGLINDKKVSALVGSYLSSMTLTSVIAAEQGHIPMISQSFVDKLTNSGYKYLFQIAPKASSFGTATVKDLMAVFKDQGVPLKTIAIVDGDDASAKAQATAVADAAQKQGLQVAANVTYPDGLTDASAIVSQLAATHADAIVGGGALSDIALIIKGLRARGVMTPIANPGGGGTLTPQFGPTLGSLANGVMSTSAWNYDLKLPGVTAANAAYQKKYNQPMPQEAGESWVAVHALAAAMETTKSSDPQVIRDQLAKAEFTTGPQSAMPPGKLAFDSTGANKYVVPVLVQWQNGSLVTIYPSDVASAKPLPLHGG